MQLSTIYLILHLLGVGVLTGVVFASLYYVIKLKSVDQLKDFIVLRHIGAWGAGLAILAGIGLAWRWASQLIADPIFMSKMALVAADGIIAEMVFIRILKDTLANSSDLTDAKKRLLPWAILSVLIIIAIISLAVVHTKSHG